MNWSLNLFKIKGIDIKIHLTFVLILVWAAYFWSSRTGEGLTGALFGVVATLLLFVSVTLHELGHSLQAIKFGVQVRNITLLPIGGVALMEEIPEDPNQELRIAIAGPLVNFAIAAVLIGIGALLNFQSLLTLDQLIASLGQVSWNGLLAYLTYANLMLGMFNLVPAYPMDGGRVLRALLSKRVGNAKATNWAAKIGQGLAFLLGLFGFMSGSWTLLFIAIFVWMGAGQENQNVQVKHTLGEATVSQAMTRAPLALWTNDPLSKAVEYTLSSSQSDFPVLDWDSNRVVGLLTEKDLVRELQTKNGRGLVRDAMQTKFASASPSDLLHASQQAMLKGRTSVLPVVGEGGDLVGFLTMEDINEAYRFLSAVPTLAFEAG